ncbi:MAG: aminoacyl-tRNA hydrolase [Thermoplasmata archaeon]|nr:aminoacyl-tRNA hydrolase [Thermoplasmata archaeon]
MARRSTAPTRGYKMVLVIRGELRLTPGKAAVQVAHGAVMLTDLARRRDPTAVDAWLREGQKKIAVVSPTLSDMEELRLRAGRKSIPTIWVEDAGLTEVAPGTRTCLAIGPATSGAIDPITGDLPLL